MTSKMYLIVKTSWACPNCSGDYFEHPVYLMRIADHSTPYEYFCPGCGCNTDYPEEEGCFWTDDTNDAQVAA